MFRAGVVGPLPRSWTIPSALGGDHKILRIRRQCFSNQFFANVRTIGVSRVDEVDAQLNRTAQYRERRSRILGWTPDSLASDTHGSETETANGQFPTQRNGSAEIREWTCCFFLHIRSPNYLSFWS